ncbi:MAG TPA: hypothetical protein VF790_01785 [Dissulfurispiraceae bacterium]
MRVILSVLTLVFLAGCAKEVCSVGDIRITENDLEHRAKVSEVYYPGSGKNYIALSQLIKGYLSLQVLEALGYRVDAAVLEEEARRIDTHTRAPDLLGKIKNIYGNDRASYLNTFVRVVYAERVLYNEVFLKSKGLSGDYDEWFWEKASRIPVEVTDEELKRELCSTISWAGRLRVE